VLKEGREALRIKRQATTVTFNMNIEGKLREMFGAPLINEEEPFVTARNSFALMTKRRFFELKTCSLGKENFSVNNKETTDEDMKALEAMMISFLRQKAESRPCAAVQSKELSKPRGTWKVDRET